MKNKISCLVILFFICLLPFAMTLNTVDTHDGYYRDGAIVMLQDHDWLVPKTAAGELRFLKPPLSYWAIAASFSVFGIDFFAARLPSIFVGCATLWLTYLFARKLTGSAKTAQLAALMLFANMPFILSSTYSLPDIWVCFFILLSMYGFLRLIIFDEITTSAFWMAYGGAAGAVLSKGLIGVGILLFAWIFAFFYGRRKLNDVKKIICFPILICVFLPIILWFCYIIYTHGSTAWSAFFNDQVTGKVRGQWWSLIYVFFYAAMLIASFLPWSLSIFEALFRLKKKLFNDLLASHNGYWFVLSGIVVTLCCFSLASPMRTRYMLPIIPLSSILLAGLLSSIEGVSLFCSLRRMLKVVLFGLFLLAIAIFLSGDGTFVDSSIFLGTAVIFAIISLYFIVFRYSWLLVTEGIALTLMLSCMVYFILLRPIVDHREDIYMVPAVVETLTAGKVRLDEPILFISKSLVGPSLLRTSLHGDSVVVAASDLDLAQAINYDVIVVPERQSAPLVAEGYSLQPIIIQKKSSFFSWILAATEHKIEKRKRYNKKYVLATRMQ